MKKKPITFYFWHFFVLIITFGSLAEVISSFLPLPEKIENSAKIFFMGLTLIGFFYEIISSLLYRYFNNNNLSNEIAKGLVLSKEERVESSVLLEIESNLDMWFNGKDDTYHIIILTLCLDLNEEKFINTIWNNIKTKKCKYLYVTPDTDQEFINSLIQKLIEIQGAKGKEISQIYKTVVSTISHIHDDSHMFKILPEYFDLCLYCKDLNQKINGEQKMGYCCYQSEPISIENTNYFFYNILSTRRSNLIFNKYKDEFTNEKLLQSYISNKTELKISSIDGFGMFCKDDETIPKNTVVFIKGGNEVRKKDVFSQSVIDSYLPIDDNLFLAAKSKEDAENIKLYINHSCEPNIGMLDERTFITLRAIESGEELVIDYAFVDNEDYEFDCNCHSKSCRKKITGHDWENIDIQKKYSKYFSPYLKKKF